MAITKENVNIGILRDDGEKYTSSVGVTKNPETDKPKVFHAEYFGETGKLELEIETRFDSEGRVSERRKSHYIYNGDLTEPKLTLNVIQTDCYNPDNGEFEFGVRLTSPHGEYGDIESDKFIKSRREKIDRDGKVTLIEEW